MKRLILLACLMTGCGPKAPELHILTWSDYFAADTVSNFEKEFGCRVTINYISSSEELRALLERPPSGYDVVFPSDEVLPPLIAGGLLEKLDHSKLSHFKDLDPRQMNLAFDPGNTCSVPYMWGTTGIAYDSGKILTEPQSWSALWDPAAQGKVSILDDPREAFAAAIWLTGGSAMEPNEDDLKRARAKLGALNLLAYDSAPKKLLVQGDVWIAQCFNGDALQAFEETEGRVRYVIPKEGGTLWVDNLCIPKGAANPDLAHAFIDYLCRPKVAAANTHATRFANPSATARTHLEKSILENPLIYPTDEQLSRCHLLGGLPAETNRVLTEEWGQLRATAK